MTDDTKNPFQVIQGGRPKEDEFPVNEYEILDIDDEVFNALGFAVFTSHHIAIMRDEGSGPLPILILPLHRVKVCQLVNPLTEDGAPF